MTLKEFIIAVRSIEALNKSTKITFARIDGCYVYDDITFEFKIDLSNAFEKLNIETLNKEIENARPYCIDGYSCFSIEFKEN